MIWGVEGRHRWADAITLNQRHRFMDEVFAHGPSLLWALDEKTGVTDLQTGHRDASPIGGVTVGGVADVPVVGFARATALDGVNDALGSSYAPFGAANPLTFGGLFRLDDAAGGALFGGSGATPPLLRIEASGDVMWWADASTGGQTMADGWPLALGEWGLWLFEFDETTNLGELWVNNVSRGTVVETHPYNVPGNYRVGAYGGGSFAEGRVGPQFVFERALTAEERSALYAAAKQVATYKVRRITGLSALGDAEDVRELAVGRRGEIPRRSYRRGKTVVYEGELIGPSLAGMRAGEDALRAAFDDQSTEKRMAVTPHPDYADGAREFYARALGLEIADEQLATPQQPSHGYERPFVLSVRMSDGRYYDAAEKTASVTVVDADDQETVQVVNGGTAESDPVLTLTSTFAPGGTKAPVMLAGKPYYTGPSGTLVRAGNVLTADASGPWSLDGVFLSPGFRFLYCDPLGVGSDDDYGLYVVDANDETTDIVTFQATRSADADASAEVVSGIRVPVLAGAAYAGKTFTLVTADPITLNTTPLRFSSAGPGAPGIVVANDSLGVYLVMLGLRLLAGDELVIDFAGRSVTFNGIDGSGLISSPSNWWNADVPGLVPGANAIRVTSWAQPVGGDFDLTCEVAWHDTYV